MALIADDAKDRAEQMLIVTERLAEMIAEETRRVVARETLAAGAEAEEKNRLTNLYRLEMSRIGLDRNLIAGAPPPTLAALREATVRLHEKLAAHEIALGAMKAVTEGLVQAMAEEVVRQRSAPPAYGARGRLEALSGPAPAIVDRSA
jgi:hypothetical protein